MPFASPFSLSGQLVVVTGAGQGIGAAIVTAMAHAQARVLLLDQDLAARPVAARADFSGFLLNPPSRTLH